MLKEVDKDELAKKRSIENSKLREKQANKDKDIKLIRLNLNKLTPENYQKLLPFFKKSVKGGPKKVQALVNFIMKGAWTQPKYIKMYAKLTTYLGSKKMFNETLKPKGKKGKKEKEVKEVRNPFKAALTSKIQNVFMRVGKSERIDVMWDTRLNFETTTDKEEMRKCTSRSTTSSRTSSASTRSCTTGRRSKSRPARSTPRTTSPTSSRSSSSLGEPASSRLTRKRKMRRSTGIG